MFKQPKLTIVTNPERAAQPEPGITLCTSIQERNIVFQQNGTAMLQRER